MYSVRPKSNCIPIPKQPQQEILKERENSNVFDPSKSSPPNEFLSKLQERLNTYSPTKRY